jgi:hypothetical protein
MRHHRIEAIMIITLMAVSVVSQLLPAHAADTLAINPSRAQEGSSPGVTLTLTIRGAVTGQSYTFYWAVVDPHGSNYTVTTTSMAPSSVYSLTEVYPRDFGPVAGITYAGQYSVAVFQTAPTVGLASAGQFGIGITDKLLYQRTQLVSIKAAGYNANDMVTINMTRGGVLAPGFPESVQADGSGNIVASWITTATTLTGNYTVSLRGTTTGPKNPPDSQWFILIPASLQVIPTVRVSGTTLAVSTAVTEPDGTSFTRGNVTGQFSFGGASVGGSLRLLYNLTEGKWTGRYSVQSTDAPGPWVLQATALDLNGNYGQGSTSLSVTPPPPNPPPQNPLTSFWFLAVMTMIGAGALIAFIFLKKKKMLPPHLQVDLKAVDVEAERLMHRNFFKSIQGQLAKKRDSGEGEKNG